MNEAYSDVLTKVYNRRYFEEELEEPEGSRRNCNDRSGRSSCCRYIWTQGRWIWLLATVTQVISRYICKTDILGSKHGGDEFLLIIPNVGKRQEFTHRPAGDSWTGSMQNLPYRYARIQLSVSIGGTIASADETIEVLWKSGPLYVSGEDT